MIPILSSYRTLENSQGTLDPLGLYTIADRLALRLVPGLRERMKHPRYMTAMAVGAVICSDFEEDEIAADEISAPSQVYEWYVVSAFVKKFDRNDPKKQLLGMPGREKTSKAFREGFQLDAASYLKTPSVFGFHGVYRTLAKNMDIVIDGVLGDFGFKLVEVWEREQKLKGYLNNDPGTAGSQFRNKLRDAVAKGLITGRVDKSWNWDFYNLLADALAPKQPGPIEADLLLNQLRSGSDASRRPIIDFLSSAAGQKFAFRGSEKILHQEMVGKGIGNLELLKAITAYEKFCRLLINAFYEILIFMRDHHGKADISSLSRLNLVKQCNQQIASVTALVEQLLGPFTYEAAMFHDHLASLGEKYTVAEWIEVFFDHHERVQKAKPPSGKAPWILEYRPGTYLLNTTQLLDEDLNDEYVHQYRSFSLLSFLKDLGKI